jgi:hypothetical protein
MSFQVGCVIATTVVGVVCFQNYTRRPSNLTNVNMRVQHAQARVLKADYAGSMGIQRQPMPSITRRHQ